MAWKLANFAQSTLSQAIAAGDTAIYIDADEVDDLPILGVGDKTKLVVFNADYTEIMNITAWNTNGTLTVERGQEGTAARAWSAGVKVVCTPTAEVFAAILAVPPAVVFTGTATNVGNNYKVDVGASNPIPTLSNGEEVSFVIPATNVAGSPVNLVITDGTSSTISKPVVYHNDQSLLGGDFAAGWLAQVRFSTNFDAWVIISDTSYQDYITTINEGPLGGVNRHPNGRMDRWNNGTNFVTPASGTETADGVSVRYDGTIGAFSIARQAFTPGQTDVPGNPMYFLRWDQSNAGSASTVRRLQARLNGVGWRAGETVTRSVWLKADTARNVTARIIQYFGTGGGPSADVTADSEVLALTTAWTRYDITATLPSIATKTIGSNADDALWLTLDLPVNVTMTIDVAQDDFRPGSIPGRFSDLLPLPWFQGGVGGSFDSASDFLSTIFPQLASVEAVSSLGLLARTAANTIVARSLTTATAGALTITNPAGTAGNPNIDVSTGLVNYAADPMSVAELASIIAPFGSAAFVADSGLVHITGSESISGVKTFASGSLAAGDTAFNATLSAPNARWNFDANDYIGYDRTANQWQLAINNVNQLTITSAAVAFATRPTFNGATALDTGNGAVLTTNTFTGLQTLNNDINLASGATQTIYYDGALDFAKNGTGNALSIDSSRNIAVTAGDLTIVAAPAALSTNSAGFRGAPNIHGDKNASFQPSDISGAGSAIVFTATATFTIPTNSSVPYPIGTVLYLPNLNGSGNVTIHPDIGVTLRRGDGTAGTGDRTLPADAASWLWKRSTNEWYIYGIFT